MLGIKISLSNIKRQYETESKNHQSLILHKKKTQKEQMK